MQQEKKTDAKPQADLLARAKDAARKELAGLRGEPEKPVRDTLLKGFGRFHATLS